MKSNTRDAQHMSSFASLILYDEIQLEEKETEQVKSSRSLRS